MIYFWCILFSLLITYIVIITIFSISWHRQELFISHTDMRCKKTLISVIIALRNEENNVNTLVNSLSRQTLQNNSFEAILVNDHSTDKTFKLLQELANKYSWLNVHQLNHTHSGKKEALQYGISKAKGELLAFTDADCQMDSEWLSTLNNFYNMKKKPDLIMGLVDIKADKWVEKIFRLEFLSLVLSSAGAAIYKRPIFCNGANLAIKSSSIKTFEQNVNFASGDDVFALHHIKKNKGKIKVLKSPKHLVSTNAPGGFSSFLEQRKRWASKSKYYTDFDTVFIALLVFFTNSFISASLIVSIYISSFSLFFAGLALKTIADLQLFLKSKDLFSYKSSILWLPVLSIIYPFYITFTAMLAIKKPFTWKGRKYFN